VRHAIDGTTAQPRYHTGVATWITTYHAVRPSDLDSLGHVNHATVLEYLEYGRWEWLTHCGRGLPTRIVPVVTRVEVEYRCEIFMGDLAITTNLAGESFYKVVFEQTIDIGADAARERAAEAKVHIAFIDASSRRPRRVRDFLTDFSSSTVVSGRQKEVEHASEIGAQATSLAGRVRKS